MEFADVRSELTCSVCREIYTDPVTLPCGHNFCLFCIGRTWDWQLGIEEDPSCPDCRRTYRRRPELNRNQKLRNIAYHFHFTDPEHDWAGMSCTYCDYSVPASRSCLRCEASLCQHHLLMHSKSEKHILVDPTKPERGKCLVHRKKLVFYCTEDGVGMCVSCWLDKEHKGHRVELLSETEEQIQRLQKQRREAQEKAAVETERIIEMFRHIREQLEALEMQLLSDISKHNEEVSHGLHDEMQKLQIRTKPLFHGIVRRKTHSLAWGTASKSGQFRMKESQSEMDPDLWSLISKKLLTGLDEIVASVKQKIHRHQLQPHVHVPKRKVPEHLHRGVGLKMEKDSAYCDLFVPTGLESGLSMLNMGLSRRKTESKPSSKHVGIQCRPMMMMASSSTQTEGFSILRHNLRSFLFEEDFSDFFQDLEPFSSDRFQPFGD